LGNLKAPDYLHSKRSKSAISNAKAHVGIKGLTLNIDITDFISTSKAKVQAFLDILFNIQLILLSIYLRSVL
jgi:hypothetical protein